MSSLGVKVPGASLFSETSCWWPPLTPFVCTACSFARSGGLVSPGRRAGKGRVFSQGGGDGAVSLRCGGRLPGVTGVGCGGSWLLGAGAGHGWRPCCRRVSWCRPPGPFRPSSSTGPPGPGPLRPLLAACPTRRAARPRRPGAPSRTSSGWPRPRRTASGRTR